jgi:predicted RNase H-like nuclease (RuvC/YqgF family)
MSHTMAGKLDEISRTIGAIETSVRDLRRRAEDDRKLHNRWHAENRAAIAALAQKLDHHADTVAALRPAVAALELSRSKLAAWASIGFAGVVVFGWIVEGAVKWAVGWILSHFQ